MVYLYFMLIIKNWSSMNFKKRYISTLCFVRKIRKLYSFWIRVDHPNNYTLPDLYDNVGLTVIIKKKKAFLHG